MMICDCLRICLFVFISGTMRFSRYGLGASSPLITTPQYHLSSGVQESASFLRISFSLRLCGCGFTNRTNISHVCGSSYDSNGLCYADRNPLATWEEARDLCAADGARLCTDTEMWSNAAQGTGCAVDRYTVWTSNECADGSHIAG
jgi:hypothetical protein